MLQIAILLAATWLSISYTVIHTRQETARVESLAGDSATMNFMAYRSAVSTYFTAHPAATGVIPDASLTFASGFIRDARWTNLISGGQLYVYSVAAPTSRMVDMVYRQSHSYINVGIKQANGDLKGPGGTVTASIPGTIPVGAIVYIGS